MTIMHLMEDDPKPQTNFKRDVMFGLSRQNKRIASKYFYNEKGCVLFTEITHQPDYYLTRCELEILDRNKGRLANYLQHSPFNVIELGPGDGIKTLLLLENFYQNRLDFTYFPVDISESYLLELNRKLAHKIPNVKMTALHSDFLSSLKWLNANKRRRNFVLFLGSSIGNFTLARTKKFLEQLYLSMYAGDLLLIGFDLKKNISLLMKAYNDDAGITRQFNLNLLIRMNHELGANFKLDDFEHFPVYNPELGAMESYLISQKIQTVNIDSINKTIRFDLFEPIHLEYSHKYTLNSVQVLARSTGFRVLETFCDQKQYFVDSLWQR